ncbi:hypothetical protein KCP73_25660 [Salmonella enterica subsp. enterica]|nr:hypothetical protein KCP73_25660 [Salmonella enterica subsp. enterica]
MQPEGLGRLFAIVKMAEGPFTNFEPMETPLGITRAARMWCRTRRRVCMKKVRAVKERFRTWARLTASWKHFHTRTKRAALSLSRRGFRKSVDWRRIVLTARLCEWAVKRGFIRAVAVITRRLHRTLHVRRLAGFEAVGIPGRRALGVSRAGYIANTLTPNVGGYWLANAEYKSVFSWHRGVRGVCASKRRTLLNGPRQTPMRALAGA